MIDFLVIGGGVAGLSAGARLSPHGKVVVLEAEDALGYHASGRSAALYEANYGLPETVTLSKASAEYHRSANGGYLSPRGLMLVAGPDQRADFEADTETLGLAPIPMDQAIARVPILNPETVGFAAWHEAAWDIDTDRMLQDFAREIRGNGGQVLTRQKVTAIRNDGHWIVQASEAFEARTLVNAAGAWADEIAKLAGVEPIGITPCRRSMARIPA